MKTSDFYFDLPEELIAQHPADQRDHSRLMHLNRETGEIEHKHFYDVIDLLEPGDLLVLNNSRVIPARLIGEREDTHSPIEFLLLKQKDLDVWEILVRPGKHAKIGKRFFIDHGTGVVIGETTEIGDDVIVYQGVTLGGTGKDTGKRHPTIGNHVLIGSGAKVLGPLTIGSNTNIASGAVVLDDIPENSTAVGVPARVVKLNGNRVDTLDQIHIPDPVAQEFARMERTIEELRTEVAALKEKQE